MAAVGGVPVNELYCPTCGTKFTDITIHVDSAEDFDPTAGYQDIMQTPAEWRRFLLCPQGHKWTIKTIWRIHNRPDLPDRVQLGQYLGGGQDG